MRKFLTTLLIFSLCHLRLDQPQLIAHSHKRDQFTVEYDKIAIDGWHVVYLSSFSGDLRPHYQEKPNPRLNPKYCINEYFAKMYMELTG